MRAHARQPAVQRDQARAGRRSAGLEGLSQQAPRPVRARRAPQRADGDTVSVRQLSARDDLRWHRCMCRSNYTASHAVECSWHAVAPAPRCRRRRSSAPPATEVYLAPLARPATWRASGRWINISNNPGYDNQPSFLPDSSGLLFTSNRDGKQMDIYRYDIAAQEGDAGDEHAGRRVFADGHAGSARRSPSIRTEADGTQRLWRFDLDGSNPRLVLENVKPVGYHAWIDDTHLALFILGAGGGARPRCNSPTRRPALATVAVDRHRPLDSDPAGHGHGQLSRDRRNAARAEGTRSEDRRDRRR